MAMNTDARSESFTVNSAVKRNRATHIDVTFEPRASLPTQQPLQIAQPSHDHGGSPHRTLRRNHQTTIAIFHPLRDHIRDITIITVEQTPLFAW
ncbi:unnamed protein product [Vicia faba]|uniref:Uncharacterized protein n=1 Tax=Vicia faba TaxID=3906 RepID=A0AAV1AST2_VICFA|nr:unnamed protein product [Vicia faba]